MVRGFCYGCCALFLLIIMNGCAPKVEVRGNMPPASKLERISVGETRMDEIVALIGTPSTVATFDSYVWYYISSRKEGFAFFDKEITDYVVLELKFNKERVLESMNRYLEEDRLALSYSEQETPTSGREFTFWEQMFGNLSAKPVDSGAE